MQYSEKIPPKTRKCKRCGEEKALEVFCKHPGCRFGHTHTCVSCKNKQSINWHHQNLEKRVHQAKTRYQKRKQFSGNWQIYFKYLLHKPKHDELSIQDLMDILEAQKGLCALSDVPLTAELAQGKVYTNASIDRIIPGGSYSKQNIRLVCSVVNSMRLNMSDEELCTWCTNILTTAKRTKYAVHEES